MSQQLTPKQLEFLKEYVKTGNAPDSYLKFYKCTRTTANVNASRLLSDPRCQEFLKQVHQKAVETASKSLNDIFAEIEKIAFSDLNEVAQVDEKGQVKLKPNADLNKLDGLSLSRSESRSAEGYSKSQSISVKQSEKLKALVELAKLRGGYKDDANAKGDRSNLQSSHRRLLSALGKFRKPTVKDGEQ